MADQIFDGGPAFPSCAWGPDGKIVSIDPGMSLRDWFAGMHAHGCISNAYSSQEAIEADALHAYRVADAMLRARDVGND